MANQNDFDDWFEQANRLVDLRRSKEALTCYDNALQLNPNSYVF
jgi:tetratricopeptide (TPR) repeat protein